MRVHVFSMSMIAEINTTIGSYKLTTNLRTIVYHYEEENRYNYFLNIITEILSCIYGSIQTRNLYARYTTEDITKGPWTDNTQHGDILMCREQGLSPGGSGRPASSRASWGQARRSRCGSHASSWGCRTCERHHRFLVWSRECRCLLLRAPERASTRCGSRAKRPGRWQWVRSDM
jgi:hypothetical protein